MKNKKEILSNILCDDTIDLSSVSIIQKEINLIETINLIEEDSLLNIDEILYSNSSVRSMS